MKKIVCAVLLTVLITGTGRAQTAKNEKSPEQQDQAQVEETQNSEKKEAAKPDEKPWPPPFTPSEEVGADAMISFPTDI